jgi:GAF domain-containing protein
VELPLAENNEGAGLDDLRNFRILDTPAERAFGQLIPLTSYICGTAIAFIGFMDADRLWFNSRVGWDAPEIPREMSFCAYTILQSDALIVCDTLADCGRFEACPLATHGGIRFYAGVSLMSSEGYALGTLVAMDTIPRG